MEELREFEASEEILKDCAKRINSFIYLPSDQKARQILKQKEYMLEFGDNGLDETIRIINQFLQKHKNASIN